MTVNRERVRMLVDALRSGTYEQINGHLRLGNRFCCLGVACEVARLHADSRELNLVVGLASINDQGEPIYAYGDVTRWFDDKIDTVLPKSVQDWYGFDRKYCGDPRLIVGPNDDMKELDAAVGEAVAATSWNDDIHASFARIADAFERTFLAEPEAEVEAEVEEVRE